MSFVRVRFSILTICLVMLPQFGQAQVNNAQIKASIAKATEFLRKTVSDGGDSGRISLSAYAMIKAGESPQDPVIQSVVEKVAKRARGKNYKPGSNGIYGAGVELMLLEAADGRKYRREMETIVAYLIKHQHSSGAWDYVGGFRGGDTSQCQYAMLGFWAAERAGIKVDRSVWDRGALWFLRTQTNEGAFVYHPKGNQGHDLTPSHSMTAAGAGCLLIARLHLYPNENDPGAQKPKKPQKTNKFGVLESVDLDTVEKPDGTKVTDPEDYNPKAGAGALLGGANRGAGWIARRFTVSGTLWKLYYLYTLERMAALMNVQRIGGHDWYREGAAYLVKSQNQSTGTWASQSGEIPATALGVLFLTKSTAKMLNRHVPLDPLGTGLLAGGRGLPDNLDQAVLKDGKVESTKELGPIDELLAELEKVEDVDVGAAQEAIVEKVQLGDREELIEQKERLVKLAKHPNDEVRRTAIWALGRTEDLKLAKLLIEALDDNNVDVMVEARNALCILSRKPLGFNLPETPFESLPASASEDERQAAVEEWRKKLKEKWGGWYYKYRPYDDRDDLSEALFEQK